MYDSPASLLDALEMSAKKNDLRPLVLCEYAHAMGNSGGGLNEYFRLFWSRKPEHVRLQGGFIWDYVDQGIDASAIGTMIHTTTNFAPTVALQQTPKAYLYGGDFTPAASEPLPSPAWAHMGNDKNFCINGLLFPDRSPHPAMFEARYLQQPVTFVIRESFESQTATVHVHNRYAFASLDHLEFRFRFTSLNLPATFETEGSISNADLAPAHNDDDVANDKVRLGSREVFAATVAVPKALHFEKWALRVWCQIAVQDTPLGVVGQLVGEEGIKGGSDAIASDSTPVKSDESTGIAVDVAADCIRISTGTYRATVADGVLKSLQLLDGTELFAEQKSEPTELQHCFYRAPIDNDKGGVASDSKLVSPTLVSMASQWATLGLPSATCKLVSTEFSQTPQPKVVTRLSHVPIKSKDALFETVTEITFTEVDLRISVRVSAGKRVLQASKRLLSLPRVGLKMGLSNHLDTVQWCGLGPHENYSDRCSSSFWGVYKSSVDSMHVPYIAPGENGARCHTTSMRITSSNQSGGLQVTFCSDNGTGNTTGLEFAGRLNSLDVANKFWKDKGDLLLGKPGRRPQGWSGFQFSVSRWSLNEHASASHDHTLPNTDGAPVWLHLDSAHMGLGGDVSWLPSAHWQALIGPEMGPWEYEFALRPIQNTPVDAA
eukprot:c39948_g1_i1.p1 GENE.c39948_g1_i1~~c39948_g1_i1.p1  ORF type:complete len:660 (+),score=140.53 c39948_g1_i1:403-2382(+)